MTLGSTKEDIEVKSTTKSPNKIKSKRFSLFFLFLWQVVKKGKNIVFWYYQPHIQTKYNWTESNMKYSNNLQSHLVIKEDTMTLVSIMLCFTTFYQLRAAVLLQCFDISLYIIKKQLINDRCTSLEKNLVLIRWYQVCI